MGIMPYALDKGPYLSIVEDYVNGDRSRALALLQHLRNGEPIVDSGPIDGQIGTFMSNADLKKHMNEHWFGMKQDQAGYWQPQQPFDEQTNTYTGFWEHWYGEAEPVFREAMRRALEVSLGIGHDQPIGRPTTPKKVPQRLRAPRHWHISLYWCCPHPWYEGWVTWKRWDATPTGGHVVVVINTPAHRAAAPAGDNARATDRDNGELYTSPVKPNPSDSADQPYTQNPTDVNADNGMWLVSQLYHHEWSLTPGDAKSSPPGSWRPPTLGNPIHSMGPVTTVAIAERDGGVMPNGRPFVPQP